MPEFSEHFSIDLTEHELDFVDISNEYDTRVDVDPYAIEIQQNILCDKASEYVRCFFSKSCRHFANETILVRFF
jgi:hypothetical protein